MQQALEATSIASIIPNVCTLSRLLFSSEAAVRLSYTPVRFLRRSLDCRPVSAAGHANGLLPDHAALRRGAAVVVGAAGTVQRPSRFNFLILLLLWWVQQALCCPCRMDVHEHETWCRVECCLSLWCSDSRVRTQRHLSVNVVQCNAHSLLLHHL